MNDGMTQGMRDLKKVDQSIRATRFLNLSVVSIDIDTLERAFDERQTIVNGVDVRLPHGVCAEKVAP